MTTVDHVVGAARGLAAESVLELHDVTKEYPTDPVTRVLHGIDLQIGRGELAAVVGPSGSGKSTLLNIIGTLDRPTAGRVVVAGLDSSELDDDDLSALRSTEIGFVFQQFFLLSGMSTVDNVADGLLYSGMALSARRERAVETLERVGLGHRLGHNPEKLS
ncbi:MAG: ABC transporter ATP-binding protein, partial [Phycicoccus sp.]